MTNTARKARSGGMRCRLCEWSEEKMSLSYFGAWYPAWPFEMLAIVLRCSSARSGRELPAQQVRNGEE